MTFEAKPNESFPTDLSLNCLKLHILAKTEEDILSIVRTIVVTLIEEDFYLK